MPATNTNNQLGHEQIIPGEEAVISQMVVEMGAQLEHMYKNTQMHRQIHTKMHGCVKATFTVEPNLPAELKVGVFSEPKKYNALVRFSNASTKPKPDSKKDVRGVAIKLLGVPGEKLLPDEKSLTTHDFLLMNKETYFAQNVVIFGPAMAAFASVKPLALPVFLLNPAHWKILAEITGSMLHCANPCSLEYWSTQPYRFGGPTKAVKYRLTPSPGNNIVNANFTDYDYLRVNLAQTLNNNEIAFDFFVQFQENADTMPIENPTIPWASPYKKLATLRIPPQSFDSKAQMEFGENLSFNPWHALPVHQPLGNFNRARKVIYLAMSKLRHAHNQQQLLEPQDSADFLSTGYVARPSNTTEEVPSSGVIKEMAEVIVDCSKETAFNYIASGDHLKEWLQKFGPIAGEKEVQMIKGPYIQPGAQRKVVFQNGDSVIEELISYNPFANYSYKVTQFSNFFNKLTDKAYGQLWIDTVDDKTRIRWVYSFTYKSIFAKMVLLPILSGSYKKFMQHALNIAKSKIENPS